MSEARHALVQYEKKATNSEQNSRNPTVRGPLYQGRSNEASAKPHLKT